MEPEKIRGRVLVVDDEPSVCGLINQALEREGYACETCLSGEEALNVLRREKFDVVITDLYMPGISGMALLEQGQKESPESAFLMATGECDVRVGVAAMKQGATDYLVKPLQLKALIASVGKAQDDKRKEIQFRHDESRLNHLVIKRSGQLKKAFRQIQEIHDQTLATLGAALDFRDDETAGHTERVCLYASQIARASQYPEGKIRDLVRGAYLHDIGKIGVPDQILLKPGRLTDAETAMMRQHVMVGFRLISHLAYLKGAMPVVLCHHERFDGAGYPRGLKGYGIPLAARIFSVADTLDAMTTDRPYRKALPFDVARAEIIRESGRQFDPEVVRAFLAVPETVWEEIRREVNQQRASGRGRSDLHPALSAVPAKEHAAGKLSSWPNLIDHSESHPSR
ncbi:MAG: HD domain-containing phosphohydrolase [Terriglobia bacterium]